MKKQIPSIIQILLCILMIFSPAMMALGQTKSDFTKRHFYGAKYEPRSTVLHGAGQSPEAFELYCKTLKPEQKPALYMAYCHLSKNSFENWEGYMKKPGGGKSLLQIGLSLKGKDPKTGKLIPIDGKIASGAHDEDIEKFCRGLKKLNQPCYIRIGYEFEGKWNGYDSKSYKQAFIRITKALRKHRVKAATVWCSAGASSGASMERLYEYYPGDEWVDWWGVDLFDEREMNSPKTATFLEHAHKHKKPVMIGESTPRRIGVHMGKGQESWDRWFQPYFKLIRDNPGIKAFSYINWDWKKESMRLKRSWGEWGDARIEENEIVAENYRKEMSLSLYQHAPPRGR